MRREKEGRKEKEEKVKIVCGKMRAPLHFEQGQGQNSQAYFQVVDLNQTIRGT